MLDLDRLHTHHHNNSLRKGSGRTTYFVYLLIGFAQLDSFKNDINIIFFSDKQRGRNLLYMIRKICGDENIPFKIFDKTDFNILNTNFRIELANKFYDVIGYKNVINGDRYDDYYDYK